MCVCVCVCRPGVRQVPEGSGEQGKMEKTGCKIISGASTTLAVKGLMMMTKRAQRKLFRNPSAENVLAFKQLKAKARHITKTQKKTSWQKFCSSLTSKTKPKTVWKAIRKIKGKKSTSSLGHLKVNGKLFVFCFCFLPSTTLWGIYFFKTHTHTNDYPL